MQSGVPLTVFGGNRWSDRRLIRIAVLVCGLVFAASLILPIGINISALYGIVVLLGLFVRAPRYPLWSSIAVTVLTIAGVSVAPIGAEWGHAVVTRALTLLGIWVTAALVAGYVRAGRSLERSMKDLADTNFALDQAAIVAITDVQGRIKYVNDTFCRISQYSRAELLGADHRIINSSYHPKAFMRDLWRTIAAGRIWRGEIRNRAKDGSFYWVDTTIVPFLDERAHPYQYMAIRYDITARKHSEAQLRERDALARLGEMAAVVAHEVKNPLAGIRGALQVLASRTADGTRDRAIFGEVLARLDSLDEIVQDLLVFARPREPKLAPVALADLLEETAGLLAKDAAHAGASITVTGDRPVIRADREQLRTVFLNLLLNAAQASGSATEVRVTISLNGPACQVAIADRGPGIPVDLREKVFEPFFTTKHRGTGLGLPTARRVVEQHHGRIALECAGTGGTVATVTLPIDPAVAETPESADVPY
jgi:PAS domain S-box-containing protein